MKTKSKRILALLLSVMMLISVIPFGTFSAFAADDAFEIKVVDADDNTVAVKDANIKITATTLVDSAETEVVSADTEFTTDENGVAFVKEITDYLADNPDAEIKMTYSATADDYRDLASAEDEPVIINAENVAEAVTLEMKQNPKVNILETVEELENADNSYIMVDGKNVGKSVQVPVGTEISVVVPLLANYKYEINATNNAANESTNNDVEGAMTYVYKVTDDFDVKIDYIIETYTITLDCANGIVTPSNNNESVKIRKTDAVTVLEIIPNEHYHLESAILEDKDNILDDVAYSATDATDGVYKYEINNELISNNDCTLTLTIKLDTFKVVAKYKDGQKGRGTAAVYTMNGDVKGDLVDLANSEIEYGKTLMLEITPGKDNKGNMYKLVNLLNGEDYARDAVEELDENQQSYRYIFKVTDNTTLTYDLGQVDLETLKGVPVNKIFNVSNSYYAGNGVYYVKKGNTAKLTYNSQIVCPEVAVDNPDGIVLDGINGLDVCINGNFRHNNLNFNENIIITPCQVTISKKGVGTETYQCEGTIDIRFESDGPTINVEKYDETFMNKEAAIGFSVEDSGAGVDADTISVSRSYGNVKNESVALNENDTYSFDYKPVEDYCGDVNYKITVKDNIGNPSNKTITVKNDTVKPELDGEVEFKNSNGNFFAQLINHISNGKWLNKEFQVIVNATDNGGVGLTADGKPSGSAQIALIDEDGKVFAYKEESFKNDKAEVGFDEMNGVFKGQIYYNICDALGNGYMEINSAKFDKTGWTLLNENNSNIKGDNGLGIVLLEENKPVIKVNEIVGVNTNLEDNSKPYVTEDGKSIYSGDVKFAFNVTDDASGIYSYEVTVNGKTVSEYGVGNDDAELNLENSFTTDGIASGDNGEYVVVFNAVDNAGNSAETVTKVVYKDTTSATIKGFDFKVVGAENKTELSSAVQVTNYGFYFKENVEVTIYAEDLEGDSKIASGVHEIKYYTRSLDPNTGDLYEEIVGKKTVSDDKCSFIIPKSFKGQIFAMATDNVGNNHTNSVIPKDYYELGMTIQKDGFVHPMSTIVESAVKHSETSAIEFTVPEAQGAQNNASNFIYEGSAQADSTMDYEKFIEAADDKNVPLYNSDITFGVKVTDTYSGIGSIKYTVFEGDEVNATETVAVDNEGKLSNNNWKTPDDYKHDEEVDKNLVTALETEIAISGNYNDMVLLVELTDRAGNTSYDYYTFGIDKTAPLITITYDNNTTDAASGTGDYFKANRTATVVVKERNFNEEDVLFTIANAEGKAPEAVFGGQTKTAEEGTNGDDNEYTFKVVFAEDGVYTFDVNYTDRATNIAGKETADSVAPFGFVVDKTAPIISVSYDNNEAMNDKFFKAPRTATITITEHQFDINRVTISQTAALAGAPIANPNVVWAHNGDTHVATITYSEDGDYTFDITMTDKAGNKETSVYYGDAVAPKDFTVDKTWENIVKVEGIANSEILGAPNNMASADPEIKITLDDVNFASYKISLVRTRTLMIDNEDVVKTVKVEEPTDVTGLFIDNPTGNANSVVSFKIPKKDKDGLSNDGLYTLRIEAADKAGNEYNTNANTIIFSVNRFGSVYQFNDALIKLIGDGNTFEQSVDENLVIYEYNPDKLESAEATVKVDLDASNAKLTRDALSTVEHSGDASWYKYTYEFVPENFEKEGLYTVTVASKDEAKNPSFNDAYDLRSVQFTIDKTAPEIENITGLEKKHVFSDEQLVTLKVRDTQGLDNIVVKINGVEDTIACQNETSITKEYKISASSSVQTISVVATDLSGRSATLEECKDTLNVNDKIIVSKNIFVHWYLETPLFIGSLVGVGVLAAGIVILVILKKKKKEEEEK